MGDKSKPPPFVQIDVPQTNALAQQLAKQGYSWSDADWARRFPELKTGREFAINNANANMAGQIDLLVAGALKKTGLADIDIGGNAYEKARNLGRPTEQIASAPERDRNYFERLFSEPMSQPRGDLAGLSGKNIAEIRAANTGNMQAYNLANFGTKVNAFNAATQAAQQQSSVIGQQLGNIAGSLTKSALQPRPQTSQSSYLNPTTYYAPAGGYGNAGFDAGSAYNYAPSNVGGTYEGQIGGVNVMRATPVNSTGDSSGGGW